jgi:hypothetical protein
MYNSDLDCNCTDLQHNKFDSLIKDEIVNPVFVEEMVNESYCVSIDFEHFDEQLNLNENDILKDLNRKMGVYFLWVYEGECTEHSMSRMLCLYVGKGFVFDRLKSHIKRKWPQCETLYVTFYECENRMAKYIEQLFLDNYDFFLNTEENSGSGHFSTVWDEQRFTFGTELDIQADRLAKKFPGQFK